MRIAIIGTGYVGLVTAVCLADTGIHTTCVDIDQEKIDLLNNDGCPIVEKGLPELIKTGVENKRLFFTTNANRAIRQSDVIFIAVGTPSKKDSDVADLSAVFAVARLIRDCANGPKIIVQKSTVPVGTSDEIEEVLNGTLENEEGEQYQHVIVSNPEFLKEGVAIADFQSPDRVVIGTDDQNARNVMKELYSPFMRKEDRMVFMSRPSAELVKVFANAMLAMRISAINSITELAEDFGADVTEIRDGVGKDSRIGLDFLFSGGATFGGSCFPKDVRALIAVMESRGINPGLFQEVLNINHDQRMRFIQKIFTYYDNDIAGKRFAVWGLAFKPGTDDIREAASIDVVRCILDKGGEVVVFDSHAQEKFKEFIGHCKGISYAKSPDAALEKADALIILTDAKIFRTFDLKKLHETMKQPVIFDGKNLHDPKNMTKEGIDYICTGRQHYKPKHIKKK